MTLYIPRQHVFRETTLNGLMALSKEHWAEARATLTTLLSRLIINILIMLFYRLMFLRLLLVEITIMMVMIIIMMLMEDSQKHKKAKRKIRCQ